MHIRRYQMILQFSLLLLAIIPYFAFGATSESTERETFTGVVRKQGATTYMYGDYVLVDEHGKTLCALRTKRDELDKYIGHKVTVIGSPIAGYPVDFGPPYIDVNSIE